jgi:hypothetical protein
MYFIVVASYHLLSSRSADINIPDLPQIPGAALRASGLPDLFQISAVAANGINIVHRTDPANGNLHTASADHDRFLEHPSTFTTTH